MIKALLHGLTGPIDGKTYAEVMVSMGQSPDDWIAAIGVVHPQRVRQSGRSHRRSRVARVRAATAGRKTSWTTAELEASLPTIAGRRPGVETDGQPQRGDGADALTIRPWTSGGPQQPGMWLQIELPQPVQLTEVEFQSSAVPLASEPAVPGAPTRTGLGGRGAPGAPPPPTLLPGFPRAYQVQVSVDGSTWSKPVAEGKGSGSRTDATFAPARARFVRDHSDGLPPPTLHGRSNGSALRISTQRQHALIPSADAARASLSSGPTRPFIAYLACYRTGLVLRRWRPPRSNAGGVAAARQFPGG